MVARLKLLWLLVALLMATSSHTSAFGVVGTPTASRVPITATNANQIKPLGRVGRGQINDVAWSADHHRLAVATWIGLWLYDADMPKALPHLLGPDSVFMTGVAFAPDGKLLAASSTQGIQLWDVTSEKAAGQPFGIRSRSLAFSPDGKTLAACGEKGVQLWDVTSSQSLGEPFGTTECSVAFSPDGKRLAWGRLPIRLWDIATRSPIMELNDRVQVMRDSATIAFTPDGARLVTTDGDHIAQWDTKTGQQVDVIPANRVWRAEVDRQGVLLSTVSKGDVFSTSLQLQNARTTVPRITFDPAIYGVDFGDLQFSPNGAVLTSHRNGYYASTMSWWDVKTLNLIGQWAGDLSTISHFRADGSLSLVTYNTGQLQILDVTTGKARLLSQTQNVSASALSPDETQLAIGYEDGSIRILDVRTGNRLFNIPRNGNASDQLIYTADGKALAAARLNKSRAQVIVVDAMTGKQRATIQSDGRLTQSLIFSPDGNRLAAQQDDGRIRFWDSHTGSQLLDLAGQPNYRGRLLFNSDGSRLAYTGVALFRLWDTTTGKQLAEWDQASQDAHDVGEAAFSPDGNCVIFVYQASLQLRATQTGSQIADVTVDSGVLHAAFSPDSQRLVIASQDHIELWDAQTGTRLAAPTAAGSQEVAAIFGPDGTFFITIGPLGILQLWDTKTGDPLTTLAGHTGRMWSIMFSPDRTLLATSSADGTLRLWGIP